MLLLGAHLTSGQRYRSTESALSSIYRRYAADGETVRSLSICVENISRASYCKTGRFLISQTRKPFCWHKAAVGRDSNSKRHVGT